MKNCDENTKLDDSFATNEKCPCAEGRFLYRIQLSNKFFF